MKVALCAIAKNERPYIEEWVAYHKIMGFDEIFIYDNVSDDGSSELLCNLDSIGEIKRVHWPRLEDIPPQRHAYNHFLERHARLYNYVLICDIDEFFYSNYGSVKKYIEAAETHTSNLGAIAIPWLMFGPNGKESKEPGLVIERFNTTRPNPNSEVKTLFDPSKAFNMRTHICDLIEGEYLDNSFKIARWESKRPIDLKDSEYGFAMMCHFYTKSREEWLIRRSGRKADRAHEEYRNLEEFNKFSDAIVVNNSLRQYTEVVASRIEEMRYKLHINCNSLTDFTVCRFDGAWIFLKLSFSQATGPLKLKVVLNDFYMHDIYTVGHGKEHIAIFRVKWKVKKLHKAVFFAPESSWSQTLVRGLKISPLTTLRFLLAYMPSAEETIFEYFLKSLADKNAKASALSFSYPSFTKFVEQGQLLTLLNKSHVSNEFESTIFINLLPKVAISKKTLSDFKSKLEKHGLNHISNSIDIA